MKRQHKRSWTATEDNTIRQAWEDGGVKQAAQWLPHRTPDAINKRASFLDLYRYKSPSSPSFTGGSALPAMDRMQRLECRRLARWAKNVGANPKFGVGFGGGYV